LTQTDPFAGIDARIRDAMLERGFGELTAVQRAVLDQQCDGRDLRISSATGSGKTVALGLLLTSELADGDAPHGRGGQASRPRHGAGPRALVITPTRELATQVRDELSWLYRGLRGLRVQSVTGGTSVMQERRNLARGPGLLVGTPGRLLDHIRSGALRCDGLSDVVLDEADQMLDMGFREDLDAIVAALPETRRAHLVSATFPEQVRKLADAFQRDALHVQGTALGAANEAIEHVVHVVRPDERYAAIVNTLLSSPQSRCLLFVRRRSDATEVAEMLAADGFSALPISGELPQAQRTRTLNAFRGGSVQVLVATDVAARGLDVPDVPLVVHGDLPEDPENLTHRSGRTGRAGRVGRSILLCPPGAVRRTQWLLRSAKITASWAPVPTPHQIQRAAGRRLRRDLHRRLTAGAGPDPAQLEHARKLLREHDAAAVVAALLEQAEPAPIREPMHVTTLPTRPESAPGSFHPRGKRPHPQRAGRNKGPGGAGRRKGPHRGRARPR
jgi:ATP-dependent RNA helicase DeaD